MWVQSSERMSKSCVRLFDREGAFGSLKNPSSPSFENARITFQVRFYLKSRFDLTATAVYKWTTEVKSKSHSTFPFLVWFLNRATVHLLQRFNGRKGPFLNIPPIFVFHSTVAMGPKKKMASKSKTAQAPDVPLARASGDDQVLTPSSLVPSTNGKIDPLEVDLTDLSFSTLDWRSVFHL